MKKMMEKCAKHCKWCPLIPITVGLIAFLLTYFLDLEAVRMLWLVLTGLMVIMATMCLIMMNVLFGTMSKK